MMYSWENTTQEVAAARPEMALLPVATTEQHGQHLPVGSKSFVLEYMARQVGAALPGSVYVLPPLPLGTSQAHLGTPGTIALSWETMTSVVRDLVESLLAQGIRKVALLVGLGDASSGAAWPSDNFIVKTAVRQLNYDHPELLAIWVQPFRAAWSDFLDIFETADKEVHAGEVITSIMLHLAPELVGEKRIDFVPEIETTFVNYTSFASVCPGGVWGCPSTASAAKGARALDAAVRCTANYISCTFEQLHAIRDDGGTKEEQSGHV